MAGKLENHRQRHREDFERATGEPFLHFHCPITDRDEPGDLCLGHVVPESLGESSNATVLQRQDVDSFYGSVVEADMITAIKARPLPTSKIILDPSLSRALRPKISVNGEEWRHYDYKSGQHGPGHTPVVIEDEHGESREIVFTKTPEEIMKIEGQKAKLVIERDYTYTIIAGLLKAAHLTMFHLLGYSYALSTNGLLIGKDVLGRFFNEQRGNKSADAKKRLPDYFHEWRNAVRPILSIGDAEYKGTIDDGNMLAVHSSSGPAFALGVFVRTNDDFHQVLLPLTPIGGPFPETVAADCVATYLKFIESPPPYFHAKRVLFNRELEQFETSSEPPVRFDWPSAE